MSRVLTSYLLSTAIRSIASPHEPTASQQPGVYEGTVLWLAKQFSSKAAINSWPSRYGVALAALTVATAVRLVLDPVLGSRAPYGIYLLAVLFVVWRAGFGPALLTIFCGTLLGRYLFEVPRGTFSFDSEANQSSLVMSLAIGVTATVLCESLRRASRENARLYQLAIQQDARKDEFLATLAHELRNPLQPIRSATFLLREIPGQPGKAVELQKTIADQTDHLIRLVNDLLDVSRITQGKIDLRHERITLQSAVHSAVEVVRPLVTEKRQQLAIALPDSDVHLEADRVRLTQILTNLLHNASKYTGTSGRIWLNAEIKGRDLFLHIRDTGIGLSAEMCSRVFDLFEQAPEGKERAQGGLGIGLTLVRSLVQLHGGTVQATSPGLGLGSEFIVQLPIIAVPARTQEQAVEKEPHAVARPNGTRLRVLVVEDSKAIAVTLKALITEWNHVVEICPDAFSAMAAVRAFKPDVVVTDLGLPRMSGYQLAVELRRLPETQHVPIIALSGYGQEADKQRSNEAGFYRHLVKPIDPAELQTALCECANAQAEGVRDPR